MHMHMKSSHHIHLEMIERSLEPASCFQLQATKHKALVIRDAINDDRGYCDALLLKIEHLISETVVTRVSSAASSPAATPAEPECARDVA
jgi:hypothetical protein